MNTASVMSQDSGPGPGKLLRVGLWIAQVLVFVAFTLFGSMKFFVPVEELAAMWIWPGVVPLWFLHLIGLIDIGGGVGILLPALTRIQPRLGVAAAAGCVLLQISAMVFHAVRGEYRAVPLNVILLALSVFILWGRGKKAPIAARK